MNVYYDVKQVGFCFDQNRIPVTLLTDQRQFCINKILDTRHVLLTGGRAVRYTCLIEGKVRYLYFWNGRWVLEGYERTEEQEDTSEILYM